MTDSRLIESTVRASLDHFTPTLKGLPLSPGSRLLMAVLVQAVVFVGFSSHLLGKEDVVIGHACL